MATEKDLVRWFCESMRTKNAEERIGASHLDSVVTEMAFKFGRADIVVFHVNGSATVIEAKDGSRGYGHVVAGIGQAGLYAAQLGMAKHAITHIRRALLWTSTGNILADALIEEACEQAGVIALPWADISLHQAVEMEISP
jgi:hypothetical protein